MADREQIIDERAAFAEKFRNTPTNAVTRIRRAADIAAAEDQEALREAAQFERRLETDPGARALFLGRERLAQGQQRQGLAERRFADQQIRADATQERLLDRDAFAQEMQLKKVSLDALNSERMMRKELRDAGHAERILQDTIKAERDIDDNIFGGVLPGTKEFADIALRTIARFPMMDPKARQSILSSAKILGDEEDFDTAWNKLTPEQKARATVSDDPKGWRISVGPEKAPKASGPTYEQLSDRYLKLLDQKPTDEADKGFVAMEKRRLLKDMQDVSSGNTAPSVQATPPSAPETKQFKNNQTGELETFTRGADGKWQKPQ